MIRQKNTRFIRRLLYPLKRRYGFAVTFYKIVEEEYTLETGVRIPTITYQKVKGVIVLPAKLWRTFETSGGNFNFGGLYDTATREVIVDPQNLNGFTINEGDYFVWDEKRWEVAQIHDLEYQTALLIVGKMVEGGPRYMREDLLIRSTLQLTQEVEEK